MVLSAVWSARDRVLCQWKECCEAPWLNPNMFPLEERLEDNVFGQHLVTRNIARLNVRFFPCMEVTSPYAIKTQRRARNAPSRGLWVPQAVSLWHKRAGVSGNLSWNLLSTL